MTLSQVPAQLVRPRRAVQRASLDDVMTYAPTWRTEREALREFMPVRFGLETRVGLGVRGGAGTFLPTDLSGCVLDYLTTCPFKDVHHLVAMIVALKPAPKPEAKAAE